MYMYVVITTTAHTTDETRNHLELHLYEQYELDRLFGGYRLTRLQLACNKNVLV